MLISALLLFGLCTYISNNGVCPYLRVTYARLLHVTYERIVCCAYKVMYVCAVLIYLRVRMLVWYVRSVAMLRYVLNQAHVHYTYVSIVCQCSSSCVAICSSLTRPILCNDAYVQYVVSTRDNVRMYVPDVSCDVCSYCTYIR
jgi:hypothetical protein